MPKVFISYSSTDGEFAKKLEESLSLEGIEVWLDERKLRVGDSIIKELGAAIEGADFVVAVLSRASVHSVWVEKELALAMTREQEEKTKVVLPVKIDDCVVPSFLRDKLYADFSIDADFSESLYQLLAVISTEEGVCGDCGNEVPLSLNNCLHCGRPTDPPNVRSARSRGERDALKKRYSNAKDVMESAHCGELLQQFEHNLEKTKVVIQCSWPILARLLDSSLALLSNYYDMATKPGLEKDDPLSRYRRIADEVLFSGYQSKMRFGVLSLDGGGLSKYGSCSLVLRDNMIERRTSFFQEDSALFLHEHGFQLPPGYRATWQDRGKLCIAKLAADIIRKRPSVDQFSSLLLRERLTSTDDEFVEAQLWGPITIRTVERVRISRDRRALLPRLEKRLASFSVDLERR